MIGARSSEHGAMTMAALFEAALGERRVHRADARASRSTRSSARSEAVRCAVSHDGGTRATIARAEAAARAGAVTALVAARPGMVPPPVATHVLNQPCTTIRGLTRSPGTSAIATGAAIAVSCVSTASTVAARAAPCRGFASEREAAPLGGRARRVRGAGIDLITARELALKLAEGARVRRRPAPRDAADGHLPARNRTAAVLVHTDASPPGSSVAPRSPPTRWPRSASPSSRSCPTTPTPGTGSACPLARLLGGAAALRRSRSRSWGRAACPGSDPARGGAVPAGLGSWGTAPGTGSAGERQLRWVGKLGGGRPSNCRQSAASSATAPSRGSMTGSESMRRSGPPTGRSRPSSGTLTLPWVSRGTTLTRCLSSRQAWRTDMSPHAEMTGVAARGGWGRQLPLYDSYRPQRVVGVASGRYAIVSNPAGSLSRGMRDWIAPRERDTRLRPPSMRGLTFAGATQQPVQPRADSRPAPAAPPSAARCRGSAGTPQPATRRLPNSRTSASIGGPWRRRTDCCAAYIHSNFHCARARTRGRRPAPPRVLRPRPPRAARARTRSRSTARCESPRRSSPGSGRRSRRRRTRRPRSPGRIRWGIQLPW